MKARILLCFVALVIMCQAVPHNLDLSSLDLSNLESLNRRSLLGERQLSLNQLNRRNLNDHLSNNEDSFRRQLNDLQSLASHLDLSSLQGNLENSYVNKDYNG